MTTLKKFNKKQSWRKNKKKYYIVRNKPDSFSRSKSPRSARARYKDSLLNPDIKKVVLKWLAVFFAICIISIFLFFIFLYYILPDPSDLDKRILPQSTKIYDRTGEKLLFEIHGEEQRTFVTLDDIPDYVKRATIAIEDKAFYEHGGISLWGIFRGVVLQKLRGRPVQGGSTLTQQFIKNSILSPERTVWRKMKEWVLAYKLEKRYSKDEIFEMYLNEIPYGSTSYGIESASQRYFGKSVRDINIAEAAILAALPQGPTRYSPYGSNVDLLIGRQQYIIDLMAEQGYLDEQEVEAAKLFELEFSPPVSNIKAPHFVMYIKEQLENEYGVKNIEQGGYRIITSLDLYKQEIAEEVITELTENYEEKWEATNASLVSIDPKTGQILAMVGSRDYFNDEIDGQVNIATAKRQPGSSLKPLIYAASFLKGYTPETILYDVVTDFSNTDEPYEPHNYDNEEHGPVTIRKALAGSLNIPAVKAIYLAGIDKVLDLAQEIGYSTLKDRDRFGLSLVLGGGEVKLIEHVNAYSAFAREGILRPITGILRIENNDGEIVEEFEDQEKKVLDPKVARTINNILSDNNARTYAFGANNWLTLGNRPVAAKTGTTNDYRDAWTIGYTPSIVTGVWVGNNDNSKMKRGAAGGAIAAPIWHDYMEKVLGDTPIEFFKTPVIPKTGKPVLDGEAGTMQTVKIDKASGLLATEYTPESFIEERIFTKPHSILYYVNKNDPTGDVPKKPEKDPQFELWESRILEWAKEQASSTEDIITDTAPPTEYDDLHIPENKPQIEIITPSNNQVIMEPLLNVRVRVNAPRGVDRVEYSINDILIFSNSQKPYYMEKDFSFLANGYYNLKTRVCDDVDNCATKNIEFNLVLEEKEKKEVVSFSLDQPTSGLAVTNIDFPLNFNFTVNNPELAAKINLYHKTEGASSPTLFKTIQPIDSAAPSTVWENIPPTGTYTVFAEIITWSKQSAKSKDIILIINNIEKPETEE